MRRRGLRGSFWPTTRQQALIRVALGPVEQAVALWRGLQPIDVRSLEAGSFCLLPLLHERLSEVAPDDPQLPLLLGTYRNTWYRNQLLLERLAALLPGFRERGVDPLIVGGAAIVGRWYSGLGSRPIPQLDLVVDPEAGATAGETVVAGGWQPAGRARGRSRFTDDEGRTLVLHEGPPAPIAGPLDPAAAYRELRASAHEQDVLAEPVLVLGPADELSFVCAMGARTVVPPSIQWLLDVAKILGSPGRPVAEDVSARVSVLRLVEPVRDTLAYLAAMSAVADIEEHLRALAAMPAHRRDRVAYSLAGAGAGRFAVVAGALSAHLRATADQPVASVIGGLPRHLGQRWGAESTAQVPAIALRKLLRLARPQRSPVPERNRSASS
ncbi:MAG TPA: nucleotidyltransferase family protein [Gaiellaceae bacterium]|nr:nucleotidyltransferase family protein [Gaiellaceae bacterium]